MYGYEVVAAIEKRAGQQFQIKEGTLYPVLYRLEDAGQVEAQWEATGRGAPRKYYSLTAKGRGQLQTLVQKWRAFVAAVTGLLEGEEKR
jgi:PadR family transcriptional regulator PadR